MATKNTSNDDDVREISILPIALIVVIVIIAAWLATIYVLHDWDSDKRGTFGDMFGSVNALFSGLALAGIILTILLQRNELLLQRQELKYTRQEFVTQNETLKIQRFENTFFNLLDIHHQIVNSIDLRYFQHSYTIEEIMSRGGEYANGEPIMLTARDVFRQTFEDMAIMLKKNPENKREEIYLKMFSRYQTDFGHYFRNLYRIVKFIDETNFSHVENDSEAFDLKYSYTSMLRGQLSAYELLWIFYNGLSENGADKFKPLIEKYALLKNMPFKLVVHIEDKSLYAETAFGLMKK